MKYFIEELKLAFDNKLYILSLNSALIIPDICSGLESSNGETSGSKYMAWFEKYCKTKFNGMLSAKDAWKLRCAVLHQGRFDHKDISYEKIIFQLPNKGVEVGTMEVNNGTPMLSISITLFVLDMLKSYEEWYSQSKDDSNVKKNLENSINFHPNGLLPFFIGVPVIA